MGQYVSYPCDIVNQVLGISPKHRNKVIEEDKSVETFESYVYSCLIIYYFINLGKFTLVSI